MRLECPYEYTKNTVSHLTGPCVDAVGTQLIAGAIITFYHTNMYKEKMSLIDCNEQYVWFSKCNLYRN